MPIRIILILALSMVVGHQVQAQIQWDDSFENGRLDTAFWDGDSALVMWPISNLHAGVYGVAGQQPEFKIYDSLGYQLRPYHHMVYRYAGDTAWHFFDTAHKAAAMDYYRFSNHQPFTNDSIYVAYWLPYSYSNLQSYAASVVGREGVSVSVPAHSYQGRDLYEFQITDTAYSDCYKEHVVVLARQHPIEHINGYFVEGLVNFLSHPTDTMAAFLRRNYHFFIYPMVNPDGVFNGSGQNALGQGLNREWADSLQLGGTPEIDSIRPAIWHATGQRVDWAIDIHSNPGSNLPYYWWGYTSASPVSPSLLARSTAYVQAVAALDDSAPGGGGSFQNFVQGNGLNSSKTAGNWFLNTFGAVSYTFEPTTEPQGISGDNQYAAQHYRQAGASLARGFADVWDTVEAFGVMLDTVAGGYFVQASGGYPPYQTLWSGSASSSSDTLLPAQTGWYTVTVTDSLGCSWSRSIFHQSTIGAVERFEVRLEVVPNPARDVFRVVGAEEFGLEQIQLIGLDGRVVTTYSPIDPGADWMEIQELPTGIYWVRASGIQGVAFLKLLVE